MICMFHLHAQPTYVKAILKDEPTGHLLGVRSHLLSDSLCGEAPVSLLTWIVLLMLVCETLTLLSDMHKLL